MNSARKEKTHQLKLINENNITSLFDIESKPGIEFFIDLLNVYLKDIPLMTEEIDSAIKNKDIGKLKYFSHKLGGSLLNLGVKKAAQITHQIEDAAKKNIINNSLIRLNQDLQLNIKLILIEIESLRDKYLESV